MSINGNGNGNRLPDLPSDNGSGSPSNDFTYTNKDERQKLVRKLRMKGVKIANIAGLLDVSERTVYNDLRELKTAVRREAVNTDHWFELGSSMIRYEDLFELVMEEAEASENEHVRHKYLKLAVAINEKRSSLAMDAGIIHRAPARVQHEEVPITQMSTDELRRRKVELIKDMLENLSLEDAKKVVPVIKDPDD